MTFRPHLRLSWRGTLPNGEMWQNNVSLVPDNATWAAFTLVDDEIDYITEHLGLVNMADDLKVDVVNYHQRAGSHIGVNAVLTRVTLAAIGADGRYTAPPNEMAVANVTGGGSNNFPFQVSRKITLETDDDLGRVKGGWYQPCPDTSFFDSTTNLWSAAHILEVRDSVATFIADLENAPGLDDNSFRVVVASQGRHNSNGSVRMAPKNCDVKRVNVGRRPDVQRRRANKISEARGADVAV